MNYNMVASGAFHRMHVMIRILICGRHLDNFGNVYLDRYPTYNGRPEDDSEIRYRMLNNVWNGRRLYHVCGSKDGEGFDFPTKGRAMDFVRKNFTGDERAVRLYDLKHCTDMYNPKKAK